MRWWGASHTGGFVVFVYVLCALVMIPGIVLLLLFGWFAIPLLLVVGIVLLLVSHQLKKKKTKEKYDQGR